MEQTLAMLGAITAFIGVAAGAFGAHALKAAIPADRLDVFKTGAQYQLIHALALFVAAWATTRFPGPWASAAGWLFTAGIVLFSGSLYALAVTGVKVLGAITPLGGLCFLAGWACLAMAALKG